MRKLLYLTLVLPIITLFIGVTSCEDDEQFFDVNQAIKDKELILDLEGGYLYANIETNKKWTARLDSVNAGLDWLFLNTESSTGNGKIELFLEPNLTGVERRATLVINCNGEVGSVSIVQRETLKGGIPTNDYEPGYLDRVVSKGLGQPYTVKNGAYSRNLTTTLFNSIVIEELQAAMVKDNPYSTGICYEMPINELEANFGKMDTLVTQTQSLKVKAGLALTFSSFKLSIDVKYNNTIASKDSTKALSIHRAFPRKGVTLAIGDVMSIWSDCQTKDLNKLKEVAEGYGISDVTVLEHLRDNLFSKVMLNQYNALKKAVTENSPTVQTRMKSFVTKYGPLYSVSCVTGGDACLSYQTKYTSYVDSFTVAGSLKVVAGELLDIHGDATYTKDAQNLLSNAQATVKIFGGDMDQASDCSSSFMNYVSAIVDGQDSATIMGNKKIYETALGAWGKSFTPENESVIHAEVEPLFSLFQSIFSSDDDVRVGQLMEEFMRKEYAATPLINMTFPNK